MINCTCSVCIVVYLKNKKTLGEQTKIRQVVFNIINLKNYHILIFKIINVIKLLLLYLLRVYIQIKLKYVL